VVVGPIADQLASEIRTALRDEVGATPDAALLPRVVAALGGRRNIADLRLRASRLCVTVHDPGAVDASALAGMVRALARPAPGSVHLIVGPAANAWFAKLKPS
jgi:PTS system N-acetylglucosamine-specific IIC component